MGTGISEASKRVPIFSFATQGGKQVSSHFRQRNWVPRQAWVLQPDEYQYGDATAEPDMSLLLLREYPQPVWWLYGGYGH